MPGAPCWRYPWLPHATVYFKRCLCSRPLRRDSALVATQVKEWVAAHESLESPVALDTFAMAWLAISWYSHGRAVASVGPEVGNEDEQA
jgi:hypothetical protein